MKPTAAVVAAALIAGTGMYLLGAHTTRVDAFTDASPYAHLRESVSAEPTPEHVVQVPRPAPLVVAQAPIRQTPAPRPVATGSSRPATQPVVVAEADTEPPRTWTKSAMIIGGSAASGAAVGGLIKGKKGALIGAAAGGGAASIYEASRRR